MPTTKRKLEDVPPKPKTHNPPDLTLRNLHALTKRIDHIEARLEKAGFLQLPRESDDA
jgi:hypothetical protein